MDIEGRIVLSTVIPDSVNFVLFGVEIFTPYSRTILRRRYSDFKKFHSELCCFAHVRFKNRTLLSLIPKFPPQHLLSISTDPDSIEQRKSELHTYLQGVLKILNSPQFHKFLPWIKLIRDFLEIERIQAQENECAKKIQEAYREWRKWKRNRMRLAKEFRRRGWVVNLEEMPDQLLLELMSWLPLEDLVIVARTNKRWYELSKQPMLWTTLNLFEGQYSIPDEYFKKICVRSWQLSSLDLRFCSQINASTLYAIALNCNPLTLQELYLDGCENVDDYALKMLVEKFPQGKPNSLLKLEENENTNYYSYMKDFELDKDLKGGGRGLKTLSIAECRKITDTGLSYLRKLKRLKYLNVLGCFSINDEGITMLTTETNNLKELNLSGTSITRNSLYAIKNCCPKLKSITLNGCRLLNPEDAEIFGNIQVELNDDTFRFQLFPSEYTSLPSVTTNILRTRSSLAIQRVSQFVMRKLNREDIEIDILRHKEVLGPYLTLADLIQDNELLTLHYQLKEETKAIEEQHEKEGWVAWVPVWVNDADVSACMRCAREFGLCWWKHHCRYCGKVVCSECSKARRFIESLGFISKKVRVCSLCVAILKEE